MAELRVPDEFIEAYASGEDHAAATRQLRAMAKRGAVADLRTLWNAAQEKRYGIFDRRRGSLKALAGDVELALVHEGGAATLALLAELLGRDRAREPEQLGELANRYAASGGSDAMQALAKHADDLPLEFFVNAVQAGVLHGAAIPEALQTAWMARSAGHPQARLPLARRPAEAAVVARLPRDAASSPSAARADHRTASEHGPATSTGSPMSVAASRRLDTPPPAIAAWVERSNGRFEWVEIELSTAVDDVTGDRILELGLESVAEVGPGALELHDASIEEVVGALFSASLGGAYNRTPGLGEARRRTWDSLGLLCGLDAQAELRDIEDAARRHRWWQFDPVGPWFHRVAWDLGLVCLRDGGKTLVVLSATDSD